MGFDLLGASLYLACGGAVLLLGIIVWRASPGERLHKITATMMFFGGLGPIVAGLGTIFTQYAPGRLGPHGELASALASVWQFFFPALLLFSLAYPVEKKWLRRFSGFSFLVSGPYLFHLALVLFLAAYGSRIEGITLPGAEDGAGLVRRTIAMSSTIVSLAITLLTRVHIRFFSFVDLFYSVAAVAVLAGSFRSEKSPKIRRQLSVILFGLGGCVTLYAIAVPLPTVVNVAVPQILHAVLVTTALLVGTGAIAFAIVSRSFLDVGAVVRRGILLSATSSVLVLIYFTTARQLDRVLLGSAGIDLPVFQALFIVLAVIFFHPILGRMEDAADRFLTGGGIAHRGVIQKLGRDVSSILDLDTLRSTILDTLRQALAVERAHLVIRDPDGELFEVDGATNGDEPISRDHPLVMAAASAEGPRLVSDLLFEVEDESSRERAGSLSERLGTRLIVPIHLPEGEGCIGFFSFGPKVTGSRYNVEDVTLLSILANQTGIAVRNARLHEEAVARRVVDEELIMARSIQESILGRQEKDFPGVDLAALSIPSRHVGGDYHDVAALEDGNLAIAIGDVSGKGVPAALLMSMLHAALHAQLGGTVSVAHWLSRMNTILCRSTEVDKFATFFLAVYDHRDRSLRFSNGGHNFPIRLGSGGEISELVTGGLVLGMLEEATYEEEAVILDPGDLLVFYTDGVTEEESARNADDLFGEDRLIDVIRAHREQPAEKIVQAVHDEVAGFREGSGFSDDFTLIVLRSEEEHS